MMSSVGDAVVAFGTIIGVALIIGLLIAFPIMCAWNWLMPVVFGLPTIGFWQAWVMMFLANVFFKNSSSSSN